MNFKGLVISDDISMKALKYSLQNNCLKALEAGCNLILHCNGQFSEMTIVAENSPFLDKLTLKKIITTISIIAFFATNSVLAAQPKSIGKFKNWETFTYNDASGKICFAQTIPLERAPKNFKREPSRLFVTFRKSEKIKNEISITSGHEYKTASVTAKSGKNEFSLFSQGSFAWLIDGEEEYNLIKTMKKASKLSVTCLLYTSDAADE